jgi:hypothetical protein
LSGIVFRTVLLPIPNLTHRHVVSSVCEEQILLFKEVGGISPIWILLRALQMQDSSTPPSPGAPLASLGELILTAILTLLHTSVPLSLLFPLRDSLSSFVSLANPYLVLKTQFKRFDSSWKSLLSFDPDRTGYSLFCASQTFFYYGIYSSHSLIFDLPIHPSTHPPTHPPTYPPTHPSTHPRPSNSLSTTHVPIYPLTHPFIFIEHLQCAALIL